VVNKIAVRVGQYHVTAGGGHGQRITAGGGHGQRITAGGGHGQRITAGGGHGQRPCLWVCVCGNLPKAYAKRYPSALSNGVIRCT